MAFVTAQPATEREAAAIAAALEQFRRDTAPPAAAEEPTVSAWQRAALLEGAGFAPDAASPWS